MSSMYLTTRVSVPASLAAGDRPDDEKGLRPRRDRVGERGIGRLVGQVPLAREKSQERPPLLGDVIADRPAQHGIAGLEGVEHRAPSDRPLPGDVERHLAFDLRQRPQVRREHNPNHASVWASTDSTAGRSRTMGAQPSPPSVDPETRPPVGPKDTPPDSRAAAAIAAA